MAKGGKNVGGTKGGRYVTYFSSKGSGGKAKTKKLLQKFHHRPKKTSGLMKAVIVILAITGIIKSIVPSELFPFHA